MLEPLELTTEPADGEDAADAIVEDGPDEDVGGGHWLNGLLRADVLAISSVGALLVAVVGVPITEFLTNVFFYGPSGPGSTAWIFLPLVTMTGVAATFGLAALRRSARERSAGWIRISAGVGSVLGGVLFLGATILWWYAANSDVFDRFPG